MAPVGATLHESGFEPVGAEELRERSLMQRASNYRQPLFSRSNYYCTFMTRMFRILGRRCIVFCMCENQIR